MALDPFLQQSLESVQAVQTTLAAGQAVFGGRFVLERHLGQGGMGQVWLSLDTALDEPRALKFVLPALLADATARKRLRNEARLGTHLAHPRIVRVFDFAEEPGGSPLAAVVMEFVEGRTLNELLAEQEIGFFEPEQIESWINDVIEGLRYAHEEKQRYHLDLKPGNIIIETATGRAKLLDFGISRSAKDTITRLTGQVSSGTLPYMSPQQLDGEPPCAADDVYGLGATVYELLTGTPPFFRGKLEDQIRSKEPESIMDRRRQNAKEGLNHGIGNEVPCEFSAKTLRMLCKTPEFRLDTIKCGQSLASNDRNKVCRAPSSHSLPLSTHESTRSNSSSSRGQYSWIKSLKFALVPSLIGVISLAISGEMISGNDWAHYGTLERAGTVLSHVLWFVIVWGFWFVSGSVFTLCSLWGARWKTLGKPMILLCFMAASTFAFVTVPFRSDPHIVIALAVDMAVAGGFGGLTAAVVLWIWHRFSERESRRQD
jgi:serine/threonine protein kinase